MSIHPLEEILHPKSIAIVGASDTGRGGGFVTPLLELGYPGKIYPINPKYKEIAGMTAYPRVRDIPGTVDYVISSIPASGVLELIADCTLKKVKCVHLFTARFSETGRKDAAELEKEILRQARKGGIRIIGPNCLGLYYPEERIAFDAGMPKESGNVGLASQSGMVAGEIVGLAGQRGVRFSKAFSYGNALDFNECDYLDYFAQDPQTRLILMYVEGVRDGKRFPVSLKKAASVKPVIVVKGGRGNAGTRATASHTGSMAGSKKIWNSVVEQAGAINAYDLDDMADLAVAFYFLPPIKGRRVGVVGGSGGSSVLAADQCEEAGLDVIPFPQDIRDKLKAENNPIWDWIGNPADFSISMGDPAAAARIGLLMAQHPDFDFMISFVRGAWRRGKEQFSMDKHLEQYMELVATGKPVALVFQERPRSLEDDEAEAMGRLSTEIKQTLIGKNLACYETVGRAARALSRMIRHYEKEPA